ncbi:Hpt domain-containing protein [Nibricoccus sp. IMCC34717]|uniref:Hpt domain-containing protein n=1 Tax=Nibricoccus sp. IMCC34717 TaxID=3034021 RepID=UPI00384EB6C0
MPTDVIIDPEAIENLRQLNPDDPDGFLRDLISIFLEDTPLRIEELRSSLATGDQPKFTRAAHSVKGSSSNMGASRLRNLSEKLEHTSKKEGLAGLAGDVEALAAVFAETKTALEKFLA